MSVVRREDHDLVGKIKGLLIVGRETYMMLDKLDMLEDDVRYVRREVTDRLFDN